MSFWGYEEYTFRKKKLWGEGPWLTEPDHLFWFDDATKYPCLILRPFGSMGALTGYVGINWKHALYGKYWADDSFPNLDVNGGITYSRIKKPKFYKHIAKNFPYRWWIGFDCGHLYDYQPVLIKVMEKVGCSADLHKTGTYKTVEYVKAECESLAKQLKELVQHV